MGSPLVPTQGSVYVDACAVIYAVEKVAPYGALLEPLWEAARLGEALIYTSELTLAEVLVKPLREGDSLLRDLFRDALLASQGMELIAVTRGVLERTAEIRAATGLRTPDAIHVSSARVSRCSHFVTNDPTFERVAGLRVLVLRDLLQP